MSTQKTWEERVREARAVGGAATPVPGMDLLRAELAERLESAHERAVRRAEELADGAERVARRLKEDGIGAVWSGNNFLGEAQGLRGALVALEGAREVFSIALRLERLEQTEGTG